VKVIVVLFYRFSKEAYNQNSTKLEQLTKMILFVHHTNLVKFGFVLSLRPTYIVHMEFN